MFGRKKREIAELKAAAVNHSAVIGDLFMAMRAAVRLLEAIAEQPMGTQRQKIRTAIKALRTKVDNYQPQFEQAGVIPKIPENPIKLDAEPDRIALPDAREVAAVKNLALVKG